MLLFSTLLLGSAYGQTDQQIATAKKIRNNFSCDNFSVTFEVTKRQLYKDSRLPKSNKFWIGIGDNCYRELDDTPHGDNVPGLSWNEKTKKVTLPFFEDGTNIEACGATLIQDEFGIVYELHVKGRRSKQASPLYEPQTLIFSCFYPMSNTPLDELPQDLQKYMNNEFVIGSSSMQFRRNGKLEQKFKVFDVELGMDNDDYAMDSEKTLIKKVGDPIMIGVYPVNLADGSISGADESDNEVKRHAERWDYFFRDCIYSGYSDGVYKEIQLLKRNCKTTKYHVQQLSQYGREDDGHIIMFEAIGFDDDSAHNITCDVDICLKTREGVHSWPRCYQPCNDPDYVAQSEEEARFYLGENEFDPVATDATPTDRTVTVAPVITILPTTFHTTSLPEEPMDDMLAALEICKNNFYNAHFYEEDLQLFLLCQYIQGRFPSQFQDLIDYSG